MEPLMLLETVADLNQAGCRIQHPHTERWIRIPAADLPGILDLVPGEIITAYREGSSGSRLAFIEAVLAARLNRRLQSVWIRSEDAISLPVEKTDPPEGYYYPEKEKTAFFKGYGRIPVDPYCVVPVPRPQGIFLERLEAAIRKYGSDPYTALAVIGHGVFTFLVQAKRLNGRKHLFGKLLHNGSQFLSMNHWACVSGWDAGTLIRRCGIDIKKLQTVSESEGDRLHAAGEDRIP